MARRVFYSFHYKADNWRVGQVRSMQSFETNALLSDNDWEKVEKGGKDAIKKWIDDQLYGKSCTIVLIGSATAGREWVNYEISKSWNDGKGLLGIHIHNLKDVEGRQSSKGQNPFDYVSFKDTGNKLSSVVQVYDPPFTDSQKVYGHINDNLVKWVDEAIAIRAKY